jgi:PleD family two-component response regulator
MTGAGRRGVSKSRRTRLTTRAVSSQPRGALIATAEEWLARALESVLQPRGYAVVRASSGAETLVQARRGRLDVVLIASHLPDLEGVEVCRALRAQALITPSTPIILMTSTPASRERRLAGLQAGAFDQLAFPIDADELLLKLDVFMRAKGDADRAREECLIDDVSGLYNARGMERCARELVANARRQHAALACVMLAADPQPPDLGMAPAVRHHLSTLLRARVRASDPIGWWDAVQFVVLAPATDAAGAAQLARRLSHAIEAAPLPEGTSLRSLEVRAGYEAVSDVHATPIEAETLLGRATTALGLARGEPGGVLLRRYTRPEKE